MKLNIIVRRDKDIRYPEKNEAKRQREEDNQRENHPSLPVNQQIDRNGICLGHWSFRPREFQSQENQSVHRSTASLGGFSLGVSLAWNSSAGDVLRNVLKASATEIGLIGGIVNAGACLGVLLVPWILKFISRTGTMFVSIPINMIGWAFICFADQKVLFLIIGRTICGIVSGVFCVVTPLYIAEIADKQIRSRLLTFFQLFINFGIMYAFLVAYGLEERETIWRYSLICAAACAPIALVNFLPESPLYHAKRGNMNAALRSLRWYRGEEYKYQEELDEFEKLVKMRRHGFKAIIKMLKKRKVLWAIIVCHGVIVAQQLSGINTMIFYALVIFNNGGSGDMTGEELTLIVGAVQVFACLLCTLTVGRISRRVLLSISAAFTGLFLILLGWYFSVRDSDPELWDDTYGWMPPTWISLFFASFNLGLGPLSWSLLADTFPMEIRLTGATSGAFLNWLLSLTATLTFGKMAITLGIPKTMWLFGGFSGIAAIFCAILVRDNSNKSMYDIHTNFGTSQRASDSGSSRIVGQT
ncbi:facilitated trehalose transporter Tret1-like isoform X2 [Venturia canescens]|uniref:facilitated trehalose transporter Tret1-like isoform X2 n=1 Tax=Venturia canescens TaxID=32260 RepID=UPI001C9BF61F|nr:facilitated trehalose transporter Tret1-like isoform X2 [Venturia canescens]